MKKTPARLRLANAVYFFRKPGKFLFFLSVFCLSINSFQVFAQSDQMTSFQNVRQIQFSKSTIQKLFDAEKVGKFNLAFKTEGKTEQMFDLKVLNHINKGEKTGAIAGLITLGKEQARLLLNRKERNGQLVYWIAILPSEGNEGFKLKSSGEIFLLERTSTNDIVTE
jgi:hypothetical protein